MKHTLPPGTYYKIFENRKRYERPPDFSCLVVMRTIRITRKIHDMNNFIEKSGHIFDTPLDL